jgi:hypothetical protein
MNASLDEDWVLGTDPAKNTSNAVSSTDGSGWGAQVIPAILLCRLTWPEQHDKECCNEKPANHYG